jgi:hypothetical protein
MRFYRYIERMVVLSINNPERSGNQIKLTIHILAALLFISSFLSIKAQNLMVGTEASAPDLFMHIEYNQELGKSVITVFRHQGIVNQFDFTGLGYALSPWATNQTHAAFSLRVGLYDLQFFGLQPLIYVQHRIRESKWILKGEFSWRQGYPSMTVKLGYRMW